MKITETSILHGPNIYSSKRVIRHILEPSEPEKASTPCFDLTRLDQLFRSLPGLHENIASCGAPGVFEQDLRDCDPFPITHLLEHVCIELQNVAGLELSCVRSSGSHDIRNHEMVYPFEDEEVGIASAQLALDWIGSLSTKTASSVENPLPSFDFSLRRDAFIKLALRCTPPVQDRALLKAARVHDIPVTQIAIRLFQLGQGRFQERLSGSKTSLTNIISNDISANKDYTKRILAGLGLPVAKYERVYRARDAVLAAKHIGYPVVVKPNASKMGRAVSVGMRNAREVRAAFARARTQGRSVIIEEFVAGEDYRMLIINGQMVAAAKRVPAHVVGDGAQTLEQLVEEVNSDPRRGNGPQQAWTRLEFDEQADRLLAELGYTRQSVPVKDEVVYLRRNANTSDGGTAVDVTDEVHPENRAIAILAATAIGLDVAGVDFLTTDISRSMREYGGSICEINSRPGLRKHMWPAKGKPRDVTGPIISMLYPPGKPSRIVIAAVTGMGETAMTARMLAYILMLDGYHVGLATSDGVFIDGRLTGPARTTGPAAARMIFLNPTVDCAVFETTPSDVLKYGLVYDLCDVCAVVNADVGAIEEELKDAIRVVTCAARRGIVLGADSECDRPPATHPSATDIYLVTLDADEPTLDSDGRRVFALEQGPEGKSISVVEKGSHLARIPLEQQTATLYGQSSHGISSAVFAAALAFSLDVNPELIRRGLDYSNPD